MLATETGRSRGILESKAWAFFCWVFPQQLISWAGNLNNFAGITVALCMVGQNMIRILRMANSCQQNDSTQVWFLDVFGAQLNFELRLLSC